MTARLSAKIMRAPRRDRCLSATPPRSAGSLTKRKAADGHLLQIEHFLIQFELARLDLGHVEHAVDQLQQMAARIHGSACAYS